MGRCVVHLRGPNDRNGNPRRLFVVVDCGGGILDVIDEGYSGEGAVKQAGYRLPVAVAFEIGASEYRRLAKRARSVG